MRVTVRKAWVLAACLGPFAAAACGGVPPGEDGGDGAPPIAMHGAALTLRVPGDHATIKAAIAAAQAGDTVEVAAGEYVEDLVLARAITLTGAGAQSTIVRGSCRFNGFGGRVSGFTFTLTGAPARPGAAGVFGDAPGAVITGNVIETWKVGLRLSASAGASVVGNVLRRNGAGIETFTTVGGVLFANNLILNNTLAGMRLNEDTDPVIVHNTFVGNGFGATPEVGGAAISILGFGTEILRNNIFVSNNAGIRVGVEEIGTHDHNLVWGNALGYYGTAAAHATDLAVDPRFADAPGGDFHLRPESPAIDAGAATVAGAAADFDGLARPVGAAPDLGAHEFRAPAPSVNLVFSEVLANPFDEDRGELLELVNRGDTPFDLAGAIVSDGDARDVLAAFQGGTTVVAAGAYAVVLDPDYAGGYDVPAGVTTVVPSNRTLGNGLATTDPVTLYAADGVTVLATYAYPFDPGNGLSAERVDLEGADVATNWRASPCLQSAGRPNCTPLTLASGLVVSEVMANPLDETTGEFVELYNGSDAPVDAAGMKLSDGQSTDTIAGWRGGETIIAARTYAVILDADWPDAQMFRVDPNAVLLTVTDPTVGNGLSMSDPVTLRTAAGAVVDTYARTLSVANGRSVEKVSLSKGDAEGNWAQSSCEDGSSPGRLNCVSSASAGARKPLVVTEVMANPLEEDTGEFIELYNRGVGAVDAAGLVLSDGDAVDALRGWQGGPTVIPAGGYGLVLDAEYAGQYALPAEVVLLTTGDTTIGSGLGIDDPLRLLEANGIEVIDTFRFPFNPGNGVSAERIDVRAFDAPKNWTASTCATRSSPGRNNCAASASGLPKRLRITEVLANQAGTETGGAGELVELFNAGDLTLDLAGIALEIGPPGGTVTRDVLAPWNGGATLLAPGAFAIVLDPQYDARFTITPGTVLVGLSDTGFGSSGLATTHAVTLYDADGVTALDAFRFPSDPGDGVSLYRISLGAADGAANWAATPCGATPGAAACPASRDVTTYASFWVDSDASEAGHHWYQAIGWPEWTRVGCELLVVCTGGAYGHAYRDNFPAPAAFTFTNPYTQHAVVFTERSSPTDTCQNPCPNASTSVGPGETKEVPASAGGWYYAVTAGPRLNALDWYAGDPERYWALPPDGVLAPFSAEVAQP